MINFFNIFFDLSPDVKDVMTVYKYLKKLLQSRICKFI